MTTEPSEANEALHLARLHEDERQIRNVIARLVHLADYGDLDDYVTLFTEDAIWDGPASPLTPEIRVVSKGVAAIRADREGRRRKGTQGAGAHIRHMNTALWVELDGSDIATAHSYFAYVREADTKPSFGLTGRYLDKFRRTSEGWKLAHRSISLAD